MRKTGVALVAIIGLAAAAYFARLYLFHPETTTLPPTTAVSDDPRLTFDTPFLNVRPDVKYVGDAACIDCHKDIAGHYAKHAMGRSMALSTDQASMEPHDAKANNPFEKFGNIYTVIHRDGKVYHREERRDKAGKTLAVTECEARYAVGSGTRGKSYLVDRDSRLFFSPISWYSEKKMWDISPGFHEELRFNRPINEQCLHCHCNQADGIEGTRNSYKTPAIHGYSIGCERCHGPGELHVRARESGDKLSKPDYTVVNPRHFQPNLRDAVCEQCHLQGEKRILVRGRHTFDYRPGMPLHEFFSVFVRKPELMESYKSVGQFEQMHRSRCYQESKGKLGCISCHDPHEKPAAEKRVEYFRERCLKCHESQGCNVQVAERKRQRPDDSCIACHMSKEGSANIPHTAVTDHRILRRVERPGPKTMPQIRPDEIPLVHFHQDQPGLDRSSTQRDLGLALVEMQGVTMNVKSFARIALPLLEQTTRDRPDDAFAWEGQARALTALEREDEALKACAKVLELQPNREACLPLAATLAKNLMRSDEAIGYLKRAVAINPYMTAYHVDLAGLYCEQRDWELAQKAAEAALKLEPLNTQARLKLITCLLRTDRRDAAKKEFDALMALQPKYESSIREWFEKQTRE